MDLIKCK